MKTRDQKIGEAMQVADDTYSTMMDAGIKIYTTPAGKSLMWIWWSKEVVDLSDIKAVQRALSSNSILPSKTPMRGTVVKDLISVCIDGADLIRNATSEVKSLAHKKRLY